MDVMQLLGGESDRIEYKQSPNANDVLQAVCALANDLGSTGAPGYLLLGVRDDRSIAGVDIDGGTLDEQQQRLVGRITSTKLFPTPSFALHAETLNGIAILIVEVHPYPVPPLVTLDGKVWVRRGTVTMRASEADIARMTERRPERAQPFDFRGVANATIDDLNTRLLEDYLSSEKADIAQPENFPVLEAWLTQRQLGRTVNGTWTPNAAALLLFGKSPQDFFPGARVEFVRYAGAEVDSPVIERATATGTLPDQIESIWAKLSANGVDVPNENQGTITSYRPIFPQQALRELVRNVIQHRAYEGTNAPSRVEWFEDRVEFSNPGGPFGRASEGTFGTHSDYRNPTITNWLLKMGYVENLGRGVRLVRLALQKNGNPELGVEVDGFTRITVRRVP